MHQVGDGFDVSLNNFISVSTGATKAPVVSFENRVKALETTAGSKKHSRKSTRGWELATLERLSRLVIRLTWRDARKNGGR